MRHFLFIPQVIFRFSGFRLWLAISLFFLVAIDTHAAKIVQLTIKGSIGPATANYLTKEITRAQDANLILVILDTPGGLNSSTRLIMQQFLSSNVPIVVYVSPTGGRAASAGTYLMYASTLAAMAPGTELGAASPVSLGDEFSNQSGRNKSILDRKALNDSLATIRSLAQLRGRDPVFAEEAILDAESMTEPEALNAGVINYIAPDTLSLLQQMNGISVVQNNKKIVLDTTNPTIQVVNPDWSTRFLSVITEPTIAYFLLLLGLYGLFFELFNPGFVLPGVIGGLSMLLALYALQLLPVNYAGLALIILSIGFMIAEGFIASFGVLGLGGTAGFILGSIMLIDTHDVSYHIAGYAIWAMAALNLIIFIFLVSIVLRSRQRVIKNGLATLIGAKGRALSEINHLEGQAIIRGEIWSVHAKVTILPDTSVKVVSAVGLLLEVEEDKALTGD